MVNIKKSEILFSSDEKRNYDLKLINNTISNINAIIKNNECYSLKQMNIDGRDLMELGYDKGRKIGEILNYLLDIVIKNPELNNNNELIGIAKKIMANK